LPVLTAGVLAKVKNWSNRSLKHYGLHSQQSGKTMNPSHRHFVYSRRNYCHTCPYRECLVLLKLWWTNL